MKITASIQMFLVLLLMICTGGFAFGQGHPGDVVQVKDNMLVITIDKKQGEAYKNLMLYFGLQEDSLFQYGNIGQLAKEGWTLTQRTKNKAVITRPLEEKNDRINWGNQPIFFDIPVVTSGSPGYPEPVDYGVNNFISSPSVFENAKDETVFYLKNNLQATKIFLSGNFNNWSTTHTPMEKTDSGWIARVHLKPGKYFYKYIVDGNWIYDVQNNLREDDGYGSFNSTYFHHNYTFRLHGYENAKKVILTGSFDQWDEKALRMYKVPGGWELNLFIREGTHAYKFIVDGNWILDPENKIVRPDGNGNFNSFMSIGDTTIFKLPGFPDARMVILSGDFNAWNRAELVMQKTESGWEIPYVLSPGNYAYKFIVDGNWVTDPANPVQVVAPEGTNSLKIIQPNYQFRLDLYPNAKDVRVTGSFNGWNASGYPMLHADAGWIFPIYLAAGKYTYKFIVDGTWIIDPANEQYEENEFGTGNSVLWIDPELEYLEK